MEGEFWAQFTDRDTSEFLDLNFSADLEATAKNRHEIREEVLLVDVIDRLGSDQDASFLSLLVCIDLVKDGW